jgi:DNA-binding transcriptional LysR family regulator
LLSSRVPDLADLEALLEIARTGSMGAAAKDLGVTQQGLSLRVRAMERRLGFLVFARTTRGSRLTAEGVVVAEWAGRLLDAAAELDAGLAALRTDRQAHLRVAASLTIAEHLLPAWLVSLRERQMSATQVVTTVEMEATNSDTVVRRVLDGDVDVGFVEGPRPPTSVRSRVIGHDEMLVVVPPSHPWARRRRPLRPDELAATPLVTREPGSGTRQALTQALQTRLPHREIAKPALELSNAASVRAAVVAGAGPSAMSSLAVADDIALGRLRVVEVDLDLRRDLRAVWTGAPTPPGGVVRDLIAIAARR